MLRGNKVKLKILLSITTVISLFNGISYLVVPSATMGSFGSAADPFGLLVARYFGASTLGIGLLSWLGRGLVKSEARRVLVTVLFVTFGLYMIVDLIGVLSRVMNALGWLFVATDLLQALGYGIFLFLGTRRSRRDYAIDGEP
jgi:hypothetical protein